jgi:hypothetical protein
MPKIKKTDPRWLLAQAAAKQLSTDGLLPDELSVAIINGQLAMFIKVIDDCMLNRPSAFLLYRWPNSFEPIVTFSIFWKKLSTRVYMSLNDPRIEYLLETPCLIVRIDPFSKDLIDIYDESHPWECVLPGELERYEKEKMLYVGDFEAAKHYIYWNLNTPGDNASPADWLQTSFIKVLHDTVTEAIRCIAENTLRDTISAEAAHLVAAGLNLYTEFPYHREVYAYCRKLWETHSGSVLQPYFDHYQITEEAKAERLGYQLHQFLTVALFSVERTKCGLILPSYDGSLDLDLVDLDPETLGKRAAHFWERMDLFPPPFFREAVGPGNIPVDPDELFTRCPKFEGDLEEAKSAIFQFLSEAHTLKSAVIPPGAYQSN